MSKRRVIFACSAAAALVAFGAANWGFHHSIDREEEAIKAFASSESYKLQREAADLDLANREENIQILANKLSNGEIEKEELINATNEYEEKKAYYNSTQFFDDCFNNSEEKKEYKNKRIDRIISYVAVPITFSLYGMLYGEALKKDKNKDDENS